MPAALENIGPRRHRALLRLNIGVRETIVRHTAGKYTRSVDETADFSGAPDTRLAIYGTLAPGRVNHHQISALAGKWQRGTVKGRLFSSGWGAAVGFPGMILDPLGPSVHVDLFESADLPEHWTRLDEFEGSGYRRVVTTVNTEEGERSAWIYVLAEQQS
jgi:gamma-glutamylcyclotransferase (GGCT)/AIG2-like uncharacterized protein YtfP